MPYTYTFDANEMTQAAQDWGCNCGPSALAFALQVSLDEVRGLIPDFETRRYTSPTMMKAALAAAGVSFTQIRELDRYGMFQETVSLVRVQWTGPWTAATANPKWAYWHTHWIATVLEGNTPVVFDCNSGMTTLESWECDLVPLITKQISRADGGWFPTHIWQLPSVPPNPQVQDE